MLDSDSLAKRIDDKVFRDNFANSVGRAGDRALRFAYCLGVVEQAVGAGELLTIAISHFPGFLICCLQKI